MTRSNLWLLGEAVVDVSLPGLSGEYKLRLGGIVHAARAAWALDANYDLFYVAPQYLNREVDTYVQSHGASSAQQIGIVRGAPNVILIAEPTEASAQGYELLMRGSYECDLHLAGITAGDPPTDALVIAGDFDIAPVVDAIPLSSRLHLDIGNRSNPLRDLHACGRQFDTIFVSTSSPIFIRDSGANVRSLVATLKPFANAIIVKENRGGTRTFIGDTEIRTPAQVRPIQHSVGVGDCFDTAYVTLSTRHPPESALAYASFIAAEYAGTTFVDDFRAAVTQVIKIGAEAIATTAGVSLPWETRAAFNIYIAAPDFDYVDRSSIETVVAALKYHNFTPRRPVVEHGQASATDSRAHRQQLCHEDLELLDECQLLIAILPFDDPGTLIEIGYAAALKKPVLLFDPGNRARNLMLTELPTLVTASLDALISETFVVVARLVNDDE